jgi:PhzF family phenazine biosynthesis protein
MTFPMLLFQVDAFTDVPFSGNPAAVYVSSTFPSDRWMQSLAAEMNLSETAFLVPTDPSADPAAYRLRWFTPTHEVDLCGHATLAAAHAIWEEWSDVDRGDGPDALVFETASGNMTATHADGGAIGLDVPADPPAGMPLPDGVLDAIGVSEAVFTGKGDRDMFIHIDNPETLASLAPDMDALASFDTRGFVVTAAGDGDADFVSRFFGPGVGVPEDPVTGSAHCALGPYWADRLGRMRLIGRQVSARGGTVGVDVHPDGRVHLSGRAVTVFRGEVAFAHSE